jgi:hypothetical protein
VKKEGEMKKERKERKEQREVLHLPFDLQFVY